MNLRFIFPFLVTLLVILIFHFTQIKLVKIYPVLANFTVFLVFFISLFAKETVIQKIAKKFEGGLDEFTKNYTRNLPACGYFLDFGFKDKKIDFEVDGSQHWLDKKIIEHDKKRNQTLIDNGWTVIRMRWDNW